MKFQFPSIFDKFKKHKNVIFENSFSKTPLNDENVFFSWIWQLQNSLKNQSDFETYFHLKSNELAAFTQNKKDIFNIRSTPYYALLSDSSMDFHSLNNSVETTEPDPIRKILMPNNSEFQLSDANHKDPLGERKNNPAPRIIHRYSDRVLFLVTDICSVYCRYCTRKHFTGNEQAFVKNDDFEKAISYIQSRPGIREVILSGGDPLTLSDTQLEKVLFRLRQIEHIEIIRIGTRMPVVCPMRVTLDLVQILRKYKPVFLMTHFNHPKEITQESAAALDLFVDHGIPVMNQAVLLNGVNNHPAILQALSRRLLFLRVKPYYLFQCDPSEGTDHLRTSVDETLQIQKDLWGHLSGLAMPHFALDIPAGGGKVGLVPNFELENNSEYRRYQGWDGIQAVYKNPLNKNRQTPSDIENYLPEWEQLKNAKLYDGE